MHGAEQQPNPYDPPAAAPEPIPDPVLPAPRRIGGWLLLPLLGMVLSFLSLAYALVTAYLPMFQADGDWWIISDSSFEGYHPLWAPLLLFEIAANLGFMVLIGYGLWLVHLRSKRFVPVAVTYYLAGLAYALIDHGLASAIPTLAADPAPASEIARAVVPALIWPLYFLRSTRVKQTFCAP